MTGARRQNEQAGGVAATVGTATRHAALRGLARGGRLLLLAGIPPCPDRTLGVAASDGRELTRCPTTMSGVRRGST